MGALALTARARPWRGNEADTFTRIHTIDIHLIGLVILHWTVVLTVGIGAFIVMVTKGPAYLADAYPLVESERPLLPGAPRVHSPRP